LFVAVHSKPLVYPNFVFFKSSNSGTIFTPDLVWWCFGVAVHLTIKMMFLSKGGYIYNMGCQSVLLSALALVALIPRS
jgi:hypothetical protein